MSATSRAGRAMAGGLGRRRLLGVSPRTLAARHAQAIERALDLGDQPGRNAGVAGRRLQLLVSEQRLNHANVRAALKQMGREAVAKRMQRARAQIGLAVQKGAAKPDISSVEALKKALLNAKSIAYADPASGATSGQYMAKAFEKLGISGELKPKTRLVAASTTQGPLVGQTVAHGEAELGIQPITELMEVQGIDVVGPLPAELQSPDLVYVAGAPYLSEQPIASKALIDFLADPKAAVVYKAKGLQPG